MQSLIFKSSHYQGTILEYISSHMSHNVNSFFYQVETSCNTYLEVVGRTCVWLLVMAPYVAPPLCAKLNDGALVPVGSELPLQK